jgi:hypothetical protein
VPTEADEWLKVLVVPRLGSDSQKQSFTKLGCRLQSALSGLMHWIFATSKGLILFARNEGAHFLTDCVETR